MYFTIIKTIADDHCSSGYHRDAFLHEESHLGEQVGASEEVSTW